MGQLLLHPGMESDSDGDDSANSELVRRRRSGRLRRIATLIAILVVSAVGTHAAVVGNWVPAITGTYIPEADHAAALATTAETSYQRGYSDGHGEGLEAGELSGFAKGQEAGHEAGYREGRSAGYSQGYDVGYNHGGDEAYADGFYSGYAEGWSDGCSFLFEGLGTSRVGDWWDYYYSSSYGSYYTQSACD